MNPGQRCAEQLLLCQGGALCDSPVVVATTVCFSCRLAAGSTRFCAGIVSTVRHLSIELKMADYSNKLYQQLEQETGIKTGREGRIQCLQGLLLLGFQGDPWCPCVCCAKWPFIVVALLF